MVQQALVNQREEKWVHEVSEASLRMLDVCGISKDVLLLVKEHLQDLTIYIANKRSFASRLVRGSVQDLYDVCDEIALQSANKRLEAVGIAIEDLELELQFLFRRLIQTRVLLLNILTN
ncbi:DUF241 domain protein [Quillaja saponaria]|uniref:DUF241 domain protein n=1 Tax=Quillaja saponaria TaxID=32244 RepID=A0AAD7PTW3_QUISA|nr:DUF241 domain protein [Quillaja saponaria]